MKTPQEAFSKTYIVKPHGGKYYVGVICLPKCLVGARVKLVLVDYLEPEEENR